MLPDRLEEGMKKKAITAMTKLRRKTIKYEREGGSGVALLMDQANIIEPQAGPSALATEPNVIASPLTEALFSEETEALIIRKTAVKAMQEDILAHDEQNKRPQNNGMSGHT